MSTRPARPSVGVVMPVRNAVSTIGLAVCSVLEQEPVVERIVLVDGGSTDRSLDCVPADDRLTIVHQHGTGLGGARNEGVSLLDTDLVGFCDADDHWLPGALVARLDHLAAHADCAAVAGRVRTFATSPTGDVPPHRAAGLGAIIDGYTPGAVLVRREVVGRFDERLRIATDAMWLARLLDSPHRFDLIGDVVLAKGVGAGTLSTDLGHFRDEMIAVVRELVERRRSARVSAGASG